MRPIATRLPMTRRGALKGAGALGAGTLLSALLPGARARAESGSSEELQLAGDQIERIRSMNLRFGFNMNHRTDDFINSVIEGGEAAAADYGIELLVGDANFDAAKQLSDVEALVQQRVDGIFMIAVDSDSISSAVRQANRADIPVIVVGGPPTRGEILSLMNSTSYQGCYEGTRYLIEELGGQGQVAVLSIPLALQTIRDRELGSEAAIEEAPGIEMVAMQPVFSQDEALSAAQNIIQANPDLAGIFANWSRAIPGAWRAIEESGRDILLCGYDAEQDGMMALHSGQPALPGGEPILRALAGQQGVLTGRAGIDGLCQHLLGTDVPADILVPTVLVTADNVEEMWSALYPSGTPPWAG